jgi:hypothetical protein
VAAAGDYRERMSRFVRRWSERCTGAGITYVLARTDVGPDRTVREYLLRRAARSLP